MDLIYWDHYYDKVLLLNLAIVIGLFTCLRLFSGTIAHMNATKELLTKDNPAFGISLSGAAFALTLMLSGIIYGGMEQENLDAGLTVLLYGVIGIGLMAVARIIFDKITLSKISIRDEIVNGNKAVAIVDAANIITAALILRAIMVWDTSNSIEGVTALFAGFAVSQVILTVTNHLRSRIFGIMNSGSCIQEQLKGGNIALALRFGGQKIAVGFAMTMASKMVVYEEYDLLPILTAWFVASIIAIILVKAVSHLAEQVILFRVNVKEEILDQRNMALGAFQAVIYISIGMLLSAL